MGLVLVGLLATGCAAVPCIVTPSDQAPVVVEFGDGITLRVDEVWVDDAGKGTLMAAGVLESQTERRWRRLKLEADLLLAPVADEHSQANGPIEAMPLRMSVSSDHLFKGVYSVGGWARCAWRDTADACLIFGGREGNLHPAIQPDRRLNDGICRRLVDAKVGALAGKYALQAHLVPVPRPAVDLAPPTVPGVLGVRQRSSASHRVFNAWHSDDQVMVALGVGHGSLVMVLHNLGAEPLRVGWGAVVWVGFDGAAVPLQVSKPSDLPAFVPAGAHLNVILHKAPGLFGWGGEGHVTGGPLLIPPGPEGEASLGQTFGIHLPLTVGDAPHPLDLRYRVQALTTAGASPVP